MLRSLPVLFTPSFLTWSIASTCRRAILAAALLMSTFSNVAMAGDGEEVIIRSDGDKTFYEYRRGGEVVEIKVVPRYGKPYYLRPVTATDGEATGEYVQSDQPEMAVPSWVIFRW